MHGGGGGHNVCFQWYIINIIPELSLILSSYLELYRKLISACLKSIVTRPSETYDMSIIVLSASKFRKLSVHHLRYILVIIGHRKTQLIT